MNKKFDLPIVIEPASPATACVIWLHGLGADGNDFVPIVPDLGLAEELGVRFVFPHASVQAVTINGGHQMRSWYDIVEADLQRKPDLVGIAESVVYLESLIEQQLEAGISMDKIVLAGFSQGGVVALDCALRREAKPAGVLALSTYLAEAIPSASGLNIFQGHGTQDDIVSVQAADSTHEALKALGADIESHRYAMAHNVCPEEIQDIGRWLQNCLDN